MQKNIKLKSLRTPADTIGYTINKKNTGELSDIVTCSFYASHVVTAAGFGGIACFNDKKTYMKAKLLRGWGRSSATMKETENASSRSNLKLKGINYDAKYIFEDFGYNFIPSEISAAFGLEQLKKLKNNIKKRRENFKFIKKYIQKNLSKYFFVPEEYNNVNTGWLAFPVLIKNTTKLERKNYKFFRKKYDTNKNNLFRQYLKTTYDEISKV